MTKTEWVEIDRDRVMKTHDAGFVIIRTVLMDDHIPIACPICDLLMRTSDDVVAYEKYETCDTCRTMWVEARKDDWLNGWRPSADELNAEINSRSISLNMST